MHSKYWKENQILRIHCISIHFSIQRVLLPLACPIADTNTKKKELDQAAEWIFWTFWNVFSICCPPVERRRSEFMNVLYPATIRNSFCKCNDKTGIFIEALGGEQTDNNTTHERSPQWINYCTTFQSYSFTSFCTFNTSPHMNWSSSRLCGKWGMPFNITINNMFQNEIWTTSIQSK